MTMKFVHHDTGEWVRHNHNTAATRTASSVVEYENLNDIDNNFVRDTFAWMLDNGMTVTNCGSSVFQIRTA
jgi:hypothetical protein